MLVIQRRKHLGRSSALGLKTELEQLGIRTEVVVLNTGTPQPDVSGYTHLLRWGSTASLTDTMPHLPDRVYNKSDYISLVNNKSRFLLMLQQERLDISPHCVILPPVNDQHLMSFGSYIEQLPRQEYILRPHKHAQGRHTYKFTDLDSLKDILRRKPKTFREGGYIRPFIDKVKEMRVYVVNGKVAVVANKTPADPNAIAWNVAQGGRFDNLRWGDWHLGACEVAIKAWSKTGLDITGVDVMIDRDDRAWFIEANSAPSLPFNSDGSTTVRHKAIAKAIAYRYNGGDYDLSGMGEQYEGWRRYIHPAVWANHARS